MSSAAAPAPQPQLLQLTGFKLGLAAMTLALANFMVVLDTTIANVSVPHIAGSLGISPSQGVWVITSYAVAEACCVPLTGWLAQRFGTVRTFIVCMLGFTAFSILCGMSSSLSMLVMARIGQGLFGGPLMPLSQTLLLRIFPKEKAGAAMGIWSATTVLAPVFGPILGGVISDNLSWHWIFFINLPVGLLVALGASRTLRFAETATQKLKIDATGLVLMVLWIGALQLILDLGRERDWFGSSLIVELAVAVAIGFALFLAWELTEKNPVVNLRVFRHRGFSASVVVISVGFATFFASVVLTPMWLQSSQGYTATWAGYATAPIGIGSFIMSPIVARLMGKYDLRGLACFGLLWMAGASLLRTQWTSGSDFATIAMPQFVQGFGVPFFFIPLTTLALASVDPEETASAAGVMSFLRTMGGAIGASIGTTMWYDQAVLARSEMVGKLQPEQTQSALSGIGFSLDQVRQSVANIVDGEALALATSHMFLLAATIFAAAAATIWLAPRAGRGVAPGAAH